MKNIRIKVFETNSSSTHSVSIYNATQGVYDTIAPNELGQVILTGGQFGWEWDKYSDAITKANYAAVFALDSKQQPYVDMLVEVIKDHTGAKEVVLDFDIDADNSDWSYVDHQSGYAEGGDAIKAFDTPATLKNFIFHPESWLFTGNDNDSEPPNFYDVEFGIEYTHQLQIEGSDLVEKFQSKPNKEQLKDALSRLMNKNPQYNRYVSNRNRYDFITWDRKDSKGKSFNSFMKMKDGVLLLFKTKEVQGSNSYREDIVDTKELKFELKKI